MRKSYQWLEQVFENRLVALVLATTVIVPLVATPADSSLKGLAAFAFEFLGLLLLAALLWRGRLNLTRESVTSFLRTGANLPILLFLGIVTISAATSSHLAISLQELMRVGVGVLLYFAVAYQFRRAHYLAKLIDTVLYLAIVSSLIGFAHYGTSAETQATGQFGDHQLFGSFLMILMPILVVTAITETRKNRQLWAQIATALTGVCLLLTQARGAWVGTVAGVATMLVLAAISVKQSGKLSNRKHELVVPIMLVVASLGFFLSLNTSATDAIKNRGASITSGTVKSEQSAAERQARYEGTLKMIGAHPIFGVGAGMYPYMQHAATEVGNKLSFKGHAEGDLTVASLSDQAHDLYLQIAAELGLPGLFVFIGMIFTFFVSGVRQIRTMKRDFRRNMLIASLGATAAFAVDAVVSPSWQFGNVMMFMWLMMGVGASCMLPSSQEAPVTERPVPARSTKALAVPMCLAMSAILPTSMFAAQAIYLPPPTYTPTSHNDTGAIVGGSVAGGVLAAGLITAAVGGPSATTSNAHILQPGEQIDIIVGGHKDLTRTALLIKDDGHVEYTAFSQASSDNGLQAAGMTATELSESLQKSLLEFSKINQGDQVVVRLNPEFVARQSKDRKSGSIAQDAVTQVGDSAHINVAGEASVPSAGIATSTNNDKGE